MKNNITLTSIEPTFGTGYHRLKVDNTIYRIPFEWKCGNYTLIEENSANSWREVEWNLPKEMDGIMYAPFGGLYFILKNRGLTFDVKDYIQSDEVLTLTVQFNESNVTYGLLFHNAHGDGLFINNDEYPIYSSQMTSGYNVPYIQEHANEPLSIYHYAMWLHFYPFFKWIKSMDIVQDEESTLHVQATFDVWCQFMKESFPSISMLDPQIFVPNLQEFLENKRISEETELHL